MLIIEVTQLDPEPILTMSYSFPENVPIHILHLANEGLVHIEIESLQDIQEEEEVNVW